MPKYLMDLSIYVNEMDDDGIVRGHGRLGVNHRAEIHCENLRQVAALLLRFDDIADEIQQVQENLP